jgi:hypothetical protein
VFASALPGVEPRSALWSAKRLAANPGRQAAAREHRGDEAYRMKLAGTFRSVLSSKNPQHAAGDCFRIFALRLPGKATVVRMQQISNRLFFHDFFRKE